MARGENRLSRVSRDAAIALIVCAAIIVGVSGLFLHFTLWRQMEPLEPDIFYTELPEIDISRVPPPKLDPLLHRLNRQRCPCGCMRTVASCRNNHRSCGVSLADARDAVAATRR